jgi:hypothetical protein
MSLAAAPMASAQYSIPDCVVTRINSITNNVSAEDAEGWNAGRDEYYRQISGEWNAETADLSPEQLAVYRNVFCQSLTITDGGVVENPDGSAYWNLDWSYIPVADWLASGGAGTSGGGSASSGSSSSGSSGSGASNSGAGVLGGNSGTVGSLPDKGDQQSTAPVASTSATVLGAAVYETEFDAVPDDLVIQYDSGARAATSLQTEDGDSFVKLVSSDNITVFVPDSADMTDYVMDVRLRVNSGDFIMTIRSGEELCSGYDFSDAEGDLYLDVSDENCDSDTIAFPTTLDAAFPVGEWVDLRLAAEGSRIAASVNGQELLVATDDTYAHGMPAIFFFPEDGGNLSIDVSSFKVSQAGTSLPAQLAQYDGTSAEVLAELRSLGLVPEGGTQIFSEPRAWFEGDGVHYQPLASANPHTHIVMAGTLTTEFHGDDYEVCTLMSRVVTDRSGTAVEFIDVGIDSDGDALISDFYDADTSDSLFYYREVENSDSPHHFLMIEDSDRLTLYLDGQLFFDRVPVENRSGSYGVGLTASDGQSRCEATNIWVYSFD